MRRRRGLVAGGVGDTGAAHIDREIAFLIRIWGHHECVDTATAAEGSFAAIRHRHLAGIKAADRFAEGEREAHSSVGHTGHVVGDGDRGSEGVKRLADLRRCRGLVACGIGDTGGAHINREGAFFIGIWRDHERVDGSADRREGALAAIGHRDLAGIKTGDDLAEGERDGHRTVGHTGRVVSDSDGGEDGVKRLADLCRCRGLVAGRVGDTGGAHIDRDVALRSRSRDDHEGVDTATAAEGSLRSVRHRDLAGIEPGDRFAEAEREAHSTVGHTGTVVGDGDRRGDGVKRLADLRRRRGLVAGRVGDTGGAHINRDIALRSGIRGDHEAVNTAAAAEASLAAIGHHHLAGIEAGDRFAEAEREAHSTVGHTGTVVGDGDRRGDGVKRLAGLRRRRGLVARRVGDTGGAHIDRDIALRFRIRGDHEGVNTATAAEASLAAIRHRHLAGIEAGDRFAEAEREAHSSVGHTGTGVGDGEGGSEGVKRLADLRRHRGLLAGGVDHTGGAHIDCDGALLSCIRHDHERVDAAAAAERSFTATRHRHLAGIEPGDRFAEGKGEAHSTGGHTGRVIGDGDEGDDGVKRLADLRRCRGLVASGVADTGGAHINRDVALHSCIRRDHERVDAAAAAERSFTATRHRHLAGIETGDGLAEAEAEGDSTVGHTGSIVGDGDGW